MSVSDEGKLLFKEQLANENSIDNTDDLAKETEIPHVGYEQLLNVISLKIYDKKKPFKESLLFYISDKLSKWVPIYVLTQ